MSDTSLPSWSLSAEPLSLSLVSKPLQQMLPFHIWAGKISFFLSPPLHVRICRHDNLRRRTANVTSASQPIAFLFTGQCGICYGIHTHDTGTETDVRTWIRMSQQGSQVWPGEADWNATKYQETVSDGTGALYLKTDWRGNSELICAVFFQSVEAN